MSSTYSIKHRRQCGLLFPVAAMCLLVMPPKVLSSSAESGVLADDKAMALEYDQWDERSPLAEDLPLAAITDEPPLNIDLVGRWLAGECLSIAVAGETAYCGVAGGLFIVDFSSPASPVELARLPLPGSRPSGGTPAALTGNAIDLSDGHAFVANWYSGLRVVDVSDPAHPREVGFHDAGEHPVSVVVRDGFAYVADHSFGLRVLDVSDPTDPREVGSCELSGISLDVALSGSHAYVASSGVGLLVIDVSDPTAPREVGACVDVRQAQGVAVAGDFAYVACDHEGLSLINISDPEEPVEVGRIDTPLHAFRVAVSGNHVFLADISSFRIYDVSDATDPQEISSLGSRSGMVRGVAVNGDMVYVANSRRGARALNVSDPADPQLVGTYATGSLTSCAAVDGDYAFVTQAQEGLWVLDISDPTAPSQLVTYGTRNSSWGRIIVRDSYAYVQAGSALRVMDVSQPEAPSEVTSYPLHATVDDFVVDGDLLYVANGFGGLRVLDITVSEAPVEIGSLQIRNRAGDVAVSNGFAYVTTDSFGLRVIDVSIPASPVEVGACLTAETTGSVAVQGDYAYVTTEETGFLHIVDVSDPTAPREIANYHTPGYTSDVAARGHHVYLTNWSSGLRVINVSDPVHPIEEGFFPTGLNPAMITLTDDHVFFTDTNTGLYILRFDEPFLTGASLDIRPGSCPNPLNVTVPKGDHGTGGVLPVAVLGSDEFDVHDIDVSSLALEGATAIQHRYKDVATPPDAEDDCACSEAGPDGHTDLSLKFGRLAVMAALGDVSGDNVPLVLTGRMKDGTAIELIDCVKIVPRKGDAGPAPIKSNEPLLTELGSATPNPFNPSTKIIFDLPKPERVSLRIYDVSGRLVRTLVNGEVFDAGRREAVWKGRDETGRQVAAGVYFYRLEAGTFSKTLRMTLLK